MADEDNEAARSKKLKTAAIAGVVLFAVLKFAVGIGWIWSLIWGGLLGAIIFYGKPGKATPGGAARPAPKPAPAPEAKSEARPEAKPAAARRPDPKPEPKPEAVAPKAAQADAPAIKPSAPLPGQAELAERKGEWKYQPEAAQSAKKTVKKRISPADMAREAAAAEDGGAQDYDGDGVAEGANEGVRPQGLKAARGGKADDLKLIKGVGPKLEKLLHSMGYYHFDQVAAWTSQEVAWVDANLTGFRGRVSRDGWVAQAKQLTESASGKSGAGAGKKKG